MWKKLFKHFWVQQLRGNDQKQPDRFVGDAYQDKIKQAKVDDDNGNKVEMSRNSILKDSLQIRVAKIKKQTFDEFLDERKQWTWLLTIRLP